MPTISASVNEFNDVDVEVAKNVSRKHTSCQASVLSTPAKEGHVDVGLIRGGEVGLELAGNGIERTLCDKLVDCTVVLTPAFIVRLIRIVASQTIVHEVNIKIWVSLLQPHGGLGGFATLFVRFVQVKFAHA